MKNPRTLLWLAFTIALGSLLGSLYFSNVLGYAPCDLCWYQRICLYPLVPILLVGLLTNDRHVYRYCFPLTVIGLLISIYHNTIYFIANHTSHPLTVPCSVSGISCTTKYIEWFGFVSIPLLALLAFLAVNILLLVYAQRTNE